MGKVVLGPAPRCVEGSVDEYQRRGWFRARGATTSGVSSGGKAGCDFGEWSAGRESYLLRLCFEDWELCWISNRIVAVVIVVELS